MNPQVYVYVSMALCLYELSMSGKDQMIIKENKGQSQRNIDA